MPLWQLPRSCDDWERESEGEDPGILQQQAAAIKVRGSHLTP